MERIDNSKFLLYIEPSKNEKLKEPINDEITEIIELALSKAVKGAANYSSIGEPEKFSIGNAWRGWHTTDCGEHSSNCDYLLENGMITNSLAPFYVQWYRNSISDIEMNKIKELIKLYKNDTRQSK